MAYGSPDSLQALPGYLADIRSGRVTTSAVLGGVAGNYEKIGGSSPLLANTKTQADAIQTSLGTDRFRCYVGMRHFAPWIEETIREMLDDGITSAVSIVMAPHFSSLSIAKYHAHIEAGLDMYRGAIDFKHIESYHDAPGLIEAFAARVVAALAEWRSTERPEVHVIFTAHSLPVRVVESGDPYDAQLRETARLIAARASVAAEQWSWSYQSAGRSQEAWLGPQLLEHLESLASEGVRNAVCLPIGFVTDHVEILYDIDIQAQIRAKELGIRLIRPPSLNIDPLFIAQLADLIRERA